MSIRNFNVKNGLTVGVANIDAATGNILTTGIANVGSLAVVGLSNLGAVGNITITGGSSGYYLQTNGSGGLSWAAVPAGDGIANGSSNVLIPTINGNVNISSNGVANVLVVSNTGANVSGTFGVTGNASVGNISATNGNFTTGNMTTGNITTINSGLMQNGASNLAIAGGGGNVTLSVNGAAKVTATADGANVTGTLGVSGNANSANFGTGTLVASAANTGLVQNGTSNVTITTSGNVSLFVGGAATAKVIATSDGANITGNLTVSSNANVSNLGTGQVVATGNISTTGQLISTATSGAPLAVASNVVVPNLNASLLSGAASNAANTASTIALRDASGNLAANFFIGNGSQLTGLSASSITNGTSNVVVDASGNVRTSVATVANVLVVTSSGANIAGTANISGNANVGNLGATGVVATGNVTASTNLISDNILGRTGAVTITAGTANANINLRPTGTGNIDANGAFITSVQDPSLAQDAATKAYVDRLVSTGISIHPGVNVATTTTLAVASGGTVTYNQPGGAGNGVGATLTTTGSYTTIDGQTLSNTMRILVKDEANAAHNGVYVRTSATVLTRSLDTDTYAPADPDALSQNDYFFVATGTLEGGTAWICSTVGTITFGTTSIVFSQFSAVQEYTAGTGLTLTPSLQNQFKITDTAVVANSYGGGDTIATFTVNQQGQLTAAANVVSAPNAANLTGTVLPTGIQSNITRTGTVTVGTWNSLVGGSATFAAGLNAGNLASLNGANITGTVANATNATAVQSNTSTNSTVLLVGTSTGGNANVALEKVGGITANMAANSITATTFIGAFNGPHNGTVGATTANTGAFTSISASQAITSTVATSTAPFVIASTTRVANLNVANAGFADAATNAAALAQSTSTATLAYPTFTTLNTAGNSAAVINTGISANLNNASITATTFVGNVTGTAGSATSATNAAAVLSQTSTNTLVYLTGTSNITNGNFSLEKVSGIFANMSSNSITATTGIFTTAANTPIVQNGSSNVTIASGGNVSLFVGGATPAKLIVTADGANVNGNLTVSANVFAVTANVSGNVLAGNMYANSGTIGAANLTGTLTTAAQPNVTSLGNLTVANVTGNLIAGNVKLNGGLTTNRSNVTVSAADTVIDQFPPSTFKTAKYIISANGAFGVQSIETLLVANSTDAWITIYGSVSSNASSEIVNLSANVNGVSGNVTLYASNIGTGVTVNLVASYI